MKNIKLFVGFWAVFMVMTLSLTNSSYASKAKVLKNIDLKTLDLKCEYASNPIGLDIRFPQLSWRIESQTRGTWQKAYQIKVADSPEKLTKDLGNIWDSDIVSSAKSTGIIFGGAELKSRTRYYWKIRIWDTNNHVSEWSEPAFFEMGLLNQADWQADWIGFTPGLTGRVLYFKGTFNLEKKVEKARVYISGIGYSELNINGSKVGNQKLDPATSDYTKRVYYTTHDVTGYLKDENVVVVSVGPGWYGIPKLKMQMEIIFSDGTSKVVTSNSMRRLTVGSIVKSSIYDGEYYDAREERQELNLLLAPDPVDAVKMKWVHAQITDAPGGKMVSQKLEPIEIVDSIVPQMINQPIPGIYVVDAGQNLAGWASLRVKGDRGTKITLKFAESLYKDGTVNQENLRSAEAQDNYILKGGSGVESWEPTFTYHGFRYIQVEGFPSLLKPADITIKIVRSAVKQVGKFNCSNELLNRIHKMVVSTEASNLHGIPTDCPQRDERNGWLNDLTVRIEQAIYNFDLSRFYAKFIDDIEDTQDNQGTITDTAPYKWGSRPADPVSASYLLLAMKCYEFYGNSEMIRQHYNGLKAWVDYLNSRTENGIVNYSYYGDWSPPAEFGGTGSTFSAVSRNTPGKMMSTGYLYYCSGILADMAAIIGNESDTHYYHELAKKIAIAFNENYWDEKTGGYGSNNQACNSFALFLGLVDQARIAGVVNNLVVDVKSHNYHLTTGNLCTKYLLEVLTENGYAEVAYKIVAQETYPSWGFMLANGATTLWERWEYQTGGAMNSHNHPMMGSVDSWFYKYVLGILPEKHGAGFDKIIVHPTILNDLSFAEGELNSVKGVIKSAWKKEGGSVYLKVTIPENSSASVFIPTRNISSISENNRKINQVKEIKFLYAQDNCAVYQLGSGSYHFKSDW